MTKVFINPGHCPDIDSGAVGNGLKECEVVLKIGKRVEEYLSRAGVKTKLVQIDGLNAITNAANAWNADYFVSIHCNSYVDSNANGTETYCFAKNTTAERLANAIHERMIKTFPELTNRGVKTANFSVLRNTKMRLAWLKLLLSATAMTQKHWSNVKTTSHGLSPVALLIFSALNLM